MHSVIEYQDGIYSLNTFKNEMLITLSYPLHKYIKKPCHKSSKNYLFKLDNFQLDLKYDNRFILFKYYKKILKFNHSQQISLMLLNNISQNLYLTGRLKYSDIIPYSMKRINRIKKDYDFRNLIDIVNFINEFQLINNE